jgi:hypothetical protein
VGHQLDVCVLDRDGNPIAGVPVTLVISGFLRHHQLESTTSGDGYAFFETAETYEQSSPVIIQIEGREFGPYSITQERWLVRV